MKLRAEAWIERVEQYLAGLPKPEMEALTQQLADAVTRQSCNGFGVTGRNRRGMAFAAP